MKLSTTIIASIFSVVCLLLSPLALAGLTILGSNVSLYPGDLLTDSEAALALLAVIVILIGLLFTLEYVITAFRGHSAVLSQRALWLGTLLYNASLLIIFGYSFIAGNFAPRTTDTASILVPLWDVTAVLLSWKALQNLQDKERDNSAELAVIETEDEL